MGMCHLLVFRCRRPGVRVPCPGFSVAKATGLGKAPPPKKAHALAARRDLKAVCLGVKEQGSSEEPGEGDKGSEKLSLRREGSGCGPLPTPFLGVSE